MKSLITFLIFTITNFYLVFQVNSQEIKYREQKKDTLNVGNQSRYFIVAEKDRFVSVFIKSSHQINAELQDSLGNLKSKFIKIDWLTNLYYVEHEVKQTGRLYISLVPEENISSTSVVIDYKINIPNVDRIMKDSLKVDTKLFEKCYYNFKLAEDRIISVGPSAELGAAGKLVYLDTKTDNFGILYPFNDSSFYSPNSFIDGYSDDVLIQFHRSGDKVISMTWKDRKDTFVKVPVAFPSRVEDYSFINGDVKLNGILILPDGNGPFPLVVFTHGSGASQKEQGFFLSYFVQYGFAVLSYDKRGAGKSTGDWVTSSFDDLADAIIKGIESVIANKNIDTSRVGLFGISQGGWVGSLAAGKSPLVKFFIMNTGSGVSINQNMAYEFECIVREKGKYKDAEINEIITFYYNLLEMASHGSSYDSIQKFISTKKEKEWLSSIPLTNLPENARWWKWQKMNGQYDNSVLASKLKCPVLWVLANNDKNVPFESSLTGIKKAIDLSGNKKFTLKHFSPATHVMIKSETGYFSDDVITERKFVQGYWPLMQKWIIDFVIKKE